MTPEREYEIAMAQAAVDLQNNEIAKRHNDRRESILEGGKWGAITGATTYPFASLYYRSKHPQQPTPPLLARKPQKTIEYWPDRDMRAIFDSVGINYKNPQNPNFQVFNSWENAVDRLKGISTTIEPKTVLTEAAVQVPKAKTLYPMHFERVNPGSRVKLRLPWEITKGKFSFKSPFYQNSTALGQNNVRYSVPLKFGPRKELQPKHQFTPEVESLLTAARRKTKNSVIGSNVVPKSTDVTQRITDPKLADGILSYFTKRGLTLNTQQYPRFRKFLKNITGKQHYFPKIQVGSKTKNLIQYLLGTALFSGAGTVAGGATGAAVDAVNQHRDKVSESKAARAVDALFGE